MTYFERKRARDNAERLRAKRQDLAASAPLIPAPERDPAWPDTALGERVGAAAGPLAALVPPPRTIHDVIDRLATLQITLDALPPGPAENRIAAFNALYLTITRRVAAALRAGVRDPAFLEMLDVEFARRYLDALAGRGGDGGPPEVWQVLFRRGADRGLSRLTAAVLGVNAHINHDLSLALISTWERLGAPDDDRVHPDYLLINEIFRQEIPQLRRGFSTRWQLALDVVAGDLDDWSQAALVRVTRAQAWEQAEAMWPLRSDPADFEAARLTTDRLAALLGEALVVSDRVVNGAGVLTESALSLARRLLGNGF